MISRNVPQILFALEETIGVRCFELRSDDGNANSGLSR
jgi:hypothetical protein